MHYPVKEMDDRKNPEDSTAGFFRDKQAYPLLCHARKQTMCFTVHISQHRAFLIQVYNTMHQITKCYSVK
jgi:hypothetical protein